MIQDDTNRPDKTNPPKNEKDKDQTPLENISTGKKGRGLGRGGGKGRRDGTGGGKGRGGGGFGGRRA